MKKYWRWFWIGICISLMVLTINTPVRASSDLREDQTWWMINGEHHQVERFLFKGQSILGACSSDCYEIDLTLYDRLTHKKIMHDDTTDTPKLVAPYDGDFSVEVSMVNCARSGGCRTWLEVDRGA